MISNYNDAVMQQMETLRQQLTEAAGALFLGRTVCWEQPNLYDQTTGIRAQGKVVEVLWLFDAEGLYFRVQQREHDDAKVTVRATRCVFVEDGEKAT